MKVTNENEWENFTNPWYFRSGVKSIDYKFENYSDIPDSFFENIKTINPESLYFNFEDLASYDVIKILKNCSPSLSWSLIYRMSFDYLVLNFVDVPIVVSQPDSDTLLYVKCKYFTCQINLDELNNGFRFTTVKSKNEDENIYINLKQVCEWEFNCIQIISDSDIIKEVYSNFPTDANLLECSITVEYINPPLNICFILILNRDKRKMIYKLWKLYSLRY